MASRRASDVAARLVRLRLASQRLVASSLRDPTEVVRHLLAQQAQDFAGAKWSLGVRAPGCTDADVERALRDAKIVRSWPMRGTLHFTAAEDLGWILDVTAPRLLAGLRGRHAALGLDARTFARADDVARRGLEGGRSLTRSELLAAFEAAGISTATQRGYHLLAHLGLGGVVCFGPRAGKEHAFVLLGEWVKRPRRLERDEALGEFARRYFISHGPATLRDLCAWTKLTVADARRGVELARAHLDSLVLGGATYFLERGAEDRLPSAAVLDATVHALPRFDEYLLGYRDRSAALAAEHADRIVPGGNGVFLATIVVGGRVVGTWRRTLRDGGRAMDIEAMPFGRLSREARAGFARASAAYGTFHGLPVRVAR